MMGKLPAIQLYPGDWLRDDVAGCSLAAQALWLRMMFVAHDSERYGYICLNGLPIPDELLARRCGATNREYQTLLAELFAAGVPRRTPDGIIYSKRMVEDAKTRAENNKRKAKQRESEVESHDCHADVTPMSQHSSPSSSFSTSDSLRSEEVDFSILEEADLRSPARLLIWIRENWPPDEVTEAHVLNIFGAAAKSLTEGDKPVGLFVSIVRKSKWRTINKTNQKRARENLASITATPPKGDNATK